jgi:hypothetical protein
MKGATRPRKGILSDKVEALLTISCSAQGQSKEQNKRLDRGGQKDIYGHGVRRRSTVSTKEAVGQISAAFRPRQIMSAFSPTRKGHLLGSKLGKNPGHTRGRLWLWLVTVQSGELVGKPFQQKLGSWEKAGQGEKRANTKLMFSRSTQVRRQTFFSMSECVPAGIFHYSLLPDSSTSSHGPPSELWTPQRTFSSSAQNHIGLLQPRKERVHLRSSRPVSCRLALLSVLPALSPFVISRLRFSGLPSLDLLLLAGSRC